MPNRNKKPKSTHSKTQENINSAIAICRLNGAQMTPLRIMILQTLWTAGHPLGAYEIRDLLSEMTDRKVAAPSIYRTLDFLCDQGVAARIERRNAYVACKHPERNHACVFFVCESCGNAKEIENPKVEQLIHEDAKRLGFAVKHRVIELSGCCEPCQQMP